MTSIFSFRRFFVLVLASTIGLSSCGGGSTRPQTTPTPAPTPAPTTPPVLGVGTLVFAIATEGADAAQTDIFSVSPDGSNLRRLTQSAPDAQGNIQPQGAPALSFDRRQIAYVSVAFEGGQSVSQLRVMNAGGSDSRLLTGDLNARGAMAPSWSPDASRLAFCKGNDGIWTIGADGTGLRQLTNRGANPAWSSTGRIAFNAAPDVQVVNLTARIPDLSGRKASGVLPPSTGSYTDIYTIGADGTGLRPITQRSQIESGLASINPAWAPDGRTLVFNSLPGSGLDAQLFLIGADGQNRRALGPSGTDATWSPNGARIAFSGETGLTLVDPSGQNPQRIGAPDGLFVEDTDWK